MVVGDCTMTYKELVYTLIAKRKKYKVDRMVLAQIIGVADSLVGQWETFKKIPNAMTLIDWCDALDVELQLGDAQTECPKDFRASEKVLSTLPCLLYTSPSPRDQRGSRMPSSA